MHSTLPQEQSRRVLGLLERLFKAYYLSAELMLPDDMDRREFAFQPLGRDTYVRHLSFRSPMELRRYVVENPPANAFFSSALFLFPSVKDMEQKGWLGSELMFDVDADALPGCEGTIKSVCMDCGFSHPGIRQCPRCGSKNVVEAETVSERCMERAKEQVTLLLEVLKGDFGFDNMVVTFTGNRGFHVRVRCSEECIRMGPEERREIVAYLKGVDLKPEELMLPRGWTRERNRYAPHPADGGWRGRIGWVLYRAYKLDPSRRYTLAELSEMGVDYDLEKLISATSIHVDEKVTMDVHRLVRIPGSLHGKTGLPTVTVRPEKLEGFRVTCGLSPFKGRLTLIPLIDIDDVYVVDRSLNLRKGERMTIEHCYALPLMLRGLAVPS